MQEEKSMDYDISNYDYVSDINIYWALKIRNYWQSRIEIDGVEYVPLNNVRAITAMSEEALEAQGKVVDAKISNENYCCIQDIIDFDNECVSEALYNIALYNQQQKRELTDEQRKILKLNGELLPENDL
tara:strand:- start:4401 stop:4787 length:387 start_codon:yes stop_codon:yes gene_type:complete